LIFSFDLFLFFFSERISEVLRWRSELTAISAEFSAQTSGTLNAFFFANHAPKTIL
jgi:hypothetical protein